MKRMEGAAFCERAFRRGIYDQRLVVPHLRFVKGIAEGFFRFPRHSRDDRGCGDAEERQTEFLARSTFLSERPLPRRRELTPAMALASMVFPQPGGP
jgi:hypothetical protein